MRYDSRMPISSLGGMKLHLRHLVPLLSLLSMLAAPCLVPSLLALAETIDESAVQSQAPGVVGPPLVEPRNCARAFPKLPSADQVTDPISSAGQVGAGPGRLKGHARKVKLDSSLRALSRSTSRLKRTSLDMMSELSRFNLLWGEPPSDYNPEMFFGGAFTREQILERFRRLPTTVFTTPGYVQLFSYRQAPRKRWLVEYTRQLGKLVNSMLSDLLATELPADRQAALAEPWAELMLSAREVQDNYMTIYTLLETTPSERFKANIVEQQKQFGAPLVAIYDALARVNATANQIRKLSPN